VIFLGRRISGQRDAKRCEQQVFGSGTYWIFRSLDVVFSLEEIVTLPIAGEFGKLLGVLPGVEGG